MLSWAGYADHKSGCRIWFYWALNPVAYAQKGLAVNEFTAARWREPVSFTTPQVSSPREPTPMHLPAVFAATHHQSCPVLRGLSQLNSHPSGGFVVASAE